MGSIKNIVKTSLKRRCTLQNYSDLYYQNFKDYIKYGNGVFPLVLRIFRINMTLKYIF